MRIPVHEPEVIAAAKGDPDKAPTTSLRDPVVKNIVLTSRYEKAREYRVMSEVVNRIPEDIATKIASIFCDSKGCAFFDVKLRAQVTLSQAKGIARSLHEAFVSENGGYNGVTIQSSQARGMSVHLDSWWSGECDDDEPYLTVNPAEPAPIRR